MSRIGREVAASGWTPGAAGEEFHEMQTPIAVSPREGRTGDPPTGPGRRLAQLLARLLDLTGLTGWRLVGAVAVVIGVVWATTAVVFGGSGG